ncbi:MAG: hypothetical protein ACRYE8_01585 [Janthinobacterium lividum]
MKKLIISIIVIVLFCLRCFSVNADGLKWEDFDKLLGYVVKFDYESYPEERGMVYKYLIDMYGNDEPILEKNQIGIDLYDINNDGKKEILAYVENPGLCGSHGCSFEIFSRDNFKSILSLTVCEDIKILKYITLGYHDILFNSQTDVYRLWRWNGKEYDLYK